MNRFQQGSLFKVKRKSCADVWVFRWYEYTSGKRTYKKQIIGTTGQFRNRLRAESLAGGFENREEITHIPGGGNSRGVGHCYIFRLIRL